MLVPPLVLIFFFNDTATTEIYTLSLHDALPIYSYDGGLYAEQIRNRNFKEIPRSEEHTSELQSLRHLVCRLLLEKNTRLSHNLGGRHSHGGTCAVPSTSHVF